MEISYEQKKHFLISFKITKYHIIFKKKISFIYYMNIIIYFPILLKIYS